MFVLNLFIFSDLIDGIILLAEVSIIKSKWRVVEIVRTLVFNLIGWLKLPEAFESFKNFFPYFQF